MVFREIEVFPEFKNSRNILPGDNVYLEKSLEFDFMFTSNLDISASYDLFGNVYGHILDLWCFGDL